MLAVDPSLKIVALELNVSYDPMGDPRNHLPTFLAPAAAGGVNAQVDAVAMHFYATCNREDYDQVLFERVEAFADVLRGVRGALPVRPELADTPVWVTENNVNADFSDASGNSICNPDRPS